jgi:spore coat polysaccharide biosynthesis predicted glycosyltransferase SpsG
VEGVEVKNYKIAFRIDISNEIGTGHLMRMKALSDVFTELNHHCVFFKGEDEPVDYSGFDIIILDTYQITNDYISVLNSPDRLLVCYDDNALYTYSCDVLLNSNLHAHELEFRFGEKIPRLFLGGKYALLRREFRESDTLEIRENAKNVFICFGGSDPHNMTPKIIHALNEIEEINLFVVLGEYTKNDEEVFKLSDKANIFKAPESISRIMKKCDIAVTAAGSMVYESACIGIPAIIITQADNQMLIADYMRRKGLAIYSDDRKNVDFDSLKKEIISLLGNFNCRREMSYKLIQSVNKNGAVSAARSILRSKIC